MSMQHYEQLSQYKHITNNKNGDWITDNSSIFPFYLQSLRLWVSLHKEYKLYLATTGKILTLILFRDQLDIVWKTAIAHTFNPLKLEPIQPHLRSNQLLWTTSKQPGWLNSLLT